MNKTFVLDTNVLLHNPQAIFTFDDNDIVIPESVIEELDNFKRGNEQRNINAREVARILYKLKNSSSATLFDGIDIGNGGKIYIRPPMDDVNIPNTWDTKKKDNEILKTCLSLMKNDSHVVLVTKDIFLGIKADDLNIKNEDYYTDAVVDIDSQYTGKTDLWLYEDEFLKYSKNRELDINSFFKVICTDDHYDETNELDIHPNEFIVVHSSRNYKSTLLGRVSADKKYIHQLFYANEHPFGVTPRNVSQIFMQEALMDSVRNTPLVVIKGPAGTAKTFYSLAVGLERVYEGNINKGEKFRKILLCRPNKLMDDDIGYLPGTEKEKIEPLFRGCFDNLCVLVDSDSDKRFDNESELQGKVDDIISRNLIDMQAIGYLRGRSIEKQWAIVDECQNTSATTIKSIVTRVGDGTKMILCGDPCQIDDQYLTDKTNGLSYIAEKMKDSALVSIITTEQSDIVRSPLAKEAVRYLERKDEE